RLALRYAACGDDRALQRHRRLQAELRTARPVKRRDAIECQPGPHPFAGNSGAAEKPGGVGDAARGIEVPGDRLVARNLLASHPTGTLVGASRVVEYTKIERWRRELLQPLEDVGEFGRPEPEPVHARIHLHPDDEAMRAAERFEQLDLQRIVHDDIEAVTR